MLEKDARKELMLYLYQKLKEEGASSCYVSDIAKEIPGSDSKQIQRIGITLRKEGLVGFVSDGPKNGHFSRLSSEGMVYVENHYLPTKEDRASQHGSTTVKTTRTVKYLRNYQPTENRALTSNMNEAPCFNVDTLAKCYADLMEDVVISADKDNVSMLGIFAPWGRGKSYFFSRVRRILPADKFDVVEFNAWKYQQTPALWAYLFESFFKGRPWWFRLLYTLKRKGLSLFLELILFSIPLLLTYLFDGDNPLKWIVGGGSLLAFFIKAIIDNADSAIGLIRKYSKGISFSSAMGIQAEVEKELEHLLRFWIYGKKLGKKAVVLYIDDIDRCNCERMVAVIDSLRTVLENEEIRKRLIVVCSIDNNRLLKAIKLHFQDIMADADEQRQEWNAQEQLDKLFLCSISLPILSTPEELEFLEKLTGESVPARKHYLPDEKERGTDVTSDSSAQDGDDHVEDNLVLSKSQLAEWIGDILELYVLTPPPRAIRHIYYRCLLAMNILHALNEKITYEVVNQIIQHSYGYEMELMDNESYRNGFVVDMVVPYDYPVKKKE